MHDVVQVYGGSERDVLLKVSFPSALPSLFAAIRIAVPGAITGALPPATRARIGLAIAERRGDAAAVCSVTLEAGAGPVSMGVERSVDDSFNAVLQVRDHGPGINPVEGKRLFQPFRKSAKDAAREIMADGGGETGIALRCAEVRGDTARLFAGCGIVADSDPDAEVREAAAKMRAVREALEG